MSSFLVHFTYPFCSVKLNEFKSTFIQFLHQSYDSTQNIFMLLLAFLLKFCSLSLFLGLYFSLLSFFHSWTTTFLGRLNFHARANATGRTLTMVIDSWWIFFLPDIWGDLQRRSLLSIWFLPLCASPNKFNWFLLKHLLFHLIRLFLLIWFFYFGRYLQWHLIIILNRLLAIILNKFKLLFFTWRSSLQLSTHRLKSTFRLIQNELRICPLFRRWCFNWLLLVLRMVYIHIQFHLRNELLGLIRYKSGLNVTSLFLLVSSRHFLLIASVD